MRRSFLLPTSWRGWCVLVCFALVIAAGLWPVIELVNRGGLVFGLPALVTWSYVILLGCCAVMALGNLLIREIDDE
ncbi:hypothetical protein ACUN9Y_04245 [Halomonas sp. V046]|uniref:hypothetical protein n=1 Tax=Halomonas sp. V046 TaxID=3459611 RepID=UPI0040445D43